MPITKINMLRICVLATLLGSLSAAAQELLIEPEIELDGESGAMRSRPIRENTTTLGTLNNEGTTTLSTVNDEGTTSLSMETSSTLTVGISQEDASLSWSYLDPDTLSLPLFSSFSGYYGESVDSPGCDDCLTPTVMYANWGRDNNQKIDVIIRTFTYWASKCHTTMKWRDPHTGEMKSQMTRGGYVANTANEMTIERRTHVERPDADYVWPYGVWRYDAVFSAMPVNTPMTYSVTCSESPPCAICSKWTMARDVQIQTPHVEKNPSHRKRYGFAVIGDLWKGYKGPIRDVRDALEGLWDDRKLDFVLGAGDISNLEGESGDYYEKIFRYYRRLGGSIPMFYVAGNHEYHWDKDGYSFFKLANLPPREHPDGRPWRASEYNDTRFNGGDETKNRKSYYAFNYGHIKFIALHHPSPAATCEGLVWSTDDVCYHDKSKLMYGEEQYNWLERQLQDAEANNMTKIVYMHADIGNCAGTVAEFCCPPSSQFGTCNPSYCLNAERGWKDLCQRDAAVYKRHRDCLNSPQCMSGIKEYTMAERRFAIRQWHLRNLLKKYNTDIVFFGHNEPDEGAYVVNEGRSNESKPWRILLSGSGSCNEEDCDLAHRVGFLHVQNFSNTCMAIDKYSTNLSLDMPVKRWVYFTDTRELVDSKNISGTHQCNQVPLYEPPASGGSSSGGGNTSIGGGGGSGIGSIHLK